MAKSKWPEVKEKLILVEAWCRDGLTEEQIANKLGISRATLEIYKKEHQDFLDTLKRGKEVIDIEVENALLKKVTGYNAEIKKTFKVKEVYYDNEGHRCEKEHLESAIDEVHIPADTTAQIFWLKNRKPKEWRDKQEVQHSGSVGVTIVDDL